MRRERTFVRGGLAGKGGALDVPAVEAAVLGRTEQYLGVGEREGKQGVLGVLVAFVGSDDDGMDHGLVPARIPCPLPPSSSDRLAG